MRRKAPAAARNRKPIADVLADELPTTGLVLEIASGTGEHAVHFARLFPQLTWQPSDRDLAALESIAAWRTHEGLPNLLPPLEIDAASPDWPIERADAVLCINMVHISAVRATEGVVLHAARVLSAEDPLIFYGPFLEDDVATAPSNVEFDGSLKQRNAEWGLRRVAWLDSLAAGCGLVRRRRVAVPANNLMLVYRKRA